LKRAVAADSGRAPAQARGHPTDMGIGNFALAHNDIMIVDDNPANLKLLEDMLAQEGHAVRSFPLGRLALAAAARIPPDLILLDINMPEMNGYEVCERLKAAGELADIPIIFLSALNEIQDKVKAFHSGAVDYVSKPFQFEEVHARVETHLKLHELQRALKAHNERLEEAVAARTKELAEAHQRLTILDSSKNDFLNLISHEFRTPLNGLLGAGEMILKKMPSSSENGELREIFDESRHRMLAILDDAMLLTEIDVSAEQFRSAQVCFRAVLSRAILKSSEFAQSQRVTFAPPPPCPDLVLGDEELLVRAFHALIETAVRFSSERQSVQLAYETGAGFLKVTIESLGKIIPNDALVGFFDLFSVGEASTPGKDMGLGPAVAYRILALFGASVCVENRNPSGIRLTISLKRCENG
jgi:two-component system sensor histidine kinase/response regulator